MVSTRGCSIALSFVVACLAARGAFADAIHDAALQGDKAKVEALIAQDPKAALAPGRNGKLPLHYAAQGGHKEIVELLLAKGTPVDSPNAAGETPLHYAAAFGKRETAEVLLAHGATIGARSIQGGTPLTYALSQSYLDLAKWLVSKGADPLDKTPDGLTLLHRQAYGGSAEAVRFLLDAGVAVDVLNNDGATPLMLACTGGNLETAQVLIERRADINLVDQAKWTPLLLALNQPKTELAKLLLDKGAKIDAKLASGWSCLHVACLNDNADAVKLLLARGAKADVADAEGQTPLHVSCGRGATAVVQALLEAGAPVSGKLSDGKTPLHLAAKGGYRDVVEALQAKGADPKAKDNAGKTAVAYARQGGHMRVAQALTGAKEPGKAPASPIAKPLGDGKVQVFYLGHSGWAVRTKSHVLIFDYFKPGRVADEPALISGSINPEELKGLKVVVFSSHDHSDHYTPSIFEWRKTLPDAKYVMGFKPQGQEGYEFAEPGKKLSFDGVEVSSTSSTDAGVAFFVKVDGVTIYHAGDNACRTPEVGGEFKAGVDGLAAEYGHADLVFAPVSGCGFGDITTVRNGDAYVYGKFSPKAVFPMHAGGGESQYAAYAAEAKGKGVKAPMHCAKDAGDAFVVSLK